jgi:hypothetical protein
MRNSLASDRGLGWPWRNSSALPFGVLALAGAFLLASSRADAGNLLVNPGFEANSGHALPVGWTRFAPPNAQVFGNYWIESTAPPHSGMLYWKEWGASYAGGATNVAVAPVIGNLFP